MDESPYRHLFGRGGAAWDEVAGSFAREFCSLLGLSAESPLYSAATAGAIALPRIMKMQSIMKEKRTEWTTQHELPVSDGPDGQPSPYCSFSLFSDLVKIFKQSDPRIKC